MKWDDKNVHEISLSPFVDIAKTKSLKTKATIDSVNREITLVKIKLQPIGRSVVEWASQVIHK